MSKVMEIKKIIDGSRKRFGDGQGLALPITVQDAFNEFEKFVSSLLGVLILALMKFRSLKDVLKTLETYRMTSARKRDRIFRFIKRGELQSAVKKCGEDVQRSLETFKVRPSVFKLINSDGSGRSHFKLNRL
jgi:hypothetical protein